ncbi:MAG: DUF2946 family protein, partial [Rhizobacter sp.]
YMRDDRVQAAGPFPTVKGSRINHDKLREFIERNYERDEQGAWFFQNGPQRVYVELESAPWIWRLHAVPGQAPRIHSHTGREATFQAALVDEDGRLYLATDLGLGVVHTLDMETAADAIEAGLWQTDDCRAAELPGRYGHRLSPQRDGGAAAHP